MSFRTGLRPPRFYPVFVSLFFFALNWVAAQNTSSDGIWDSVDAIPQAKQGGGDWIRPAKFRTVKIDVFRLFQAFDKAPDRDSAAAQKQLPVIELPLPDGGYGAFEYFEAPILSPELAGKFPEIRSFIGQGVDDPRATVRFNWTGAGFDAQVLSPNGAFYIDPAGRGETEYYMSYFKRDYVNADKQWLCGVDEEFSLKGLPAGKQPVLQAVTGNVLRKYTLAVACTHEYASAVVSPVDDPTTGPDPDIALVRAAIVKTITRVTGIYETELSITFEMTANNDQLIFLNAATDPFTGNSTDTILINESQTVIDAIIGDANYDIGHTFSTGAGGLAGVGVVCTSGQKARGVTGSTQPFNDPYDVDFVAHEIGHQFSANHTFNGTQSGCAGNRSAASAFEPGSGSTIMAYAGVCGTDDIQPHTDPYFHFRSIDQIFAFISAGGGLCATNLPVNGNIAPVFPGNAANVALQVPRSTPFFLTTVGQDANADAVSFNFEEADLGTAATLGTPDNGNIPLFRSVSPLIDPTRSFPNLQKLLSNSFQPNEILPATTRVMSFRVTARDNRAGHGGTNTIVRTVQVNGTVQPFTVNTLNSGGSVAGGSSLNVQWTNPGGVFGGRLVGIFLSTDGGNSFPFNLTPANGVAMSSGNFNIIVPQVNTTQARLMLRGITGGTTVQEAVNYFFDVNNQNFTITGANNVLFLNGDFIQIPIVRSPFPGKMVIGGSSTGVGGKFNANGTGGGAGVDIWGPGFPHHGYIISRGPTSKTDGTGFDGQTTVTVQETGNLNKAVIQGHPFPGLLWTRTITFFDDEKVIELEDKMKNETQATIVDVKMNDSIDPDQGVPLGFGFSTFGDVRAENTSDVPGQNDVAVSTITGGITCGMGMPNAASVPSIEGTSPGLAPNAILFSPKDPGGALTAEYLNSAHNFGNLAAGEEKNKFWYIFFGATLEDGVQNFKDKLSQNINIELEPPDLFFGTIPNDTVSTPLTFKIKNDGTAIMRFEGPGIQLIGIDPDEFTFVNGPPDSSDIPPSGSRDYVMDFRPTGREGLRTAQVEISTNDPEDPVVFVNLSGFGFQEEEFNIIAPDGGEILFNGQEYTLRWFPETARIGNFVKIELRIGTTITVLTPSTDNDGEFKFTVPIDQAAGSTYRIRITSVSNPSIFDQSLNFFQIVNAVSLSIFDPSPGKVVVIGDNFQIKWQAQGFPSFVGQTVKVDLLKGGSFFASISGANGTQMSDTNGNGSDFWPVGTSFNVPAPDADYQIRITHTATPTINDTSSFFTIIPAPQIIVQDPGSEAVVIKGQPQPITWRTFGNVGSSLRIELFKDGTLIDTLASSVSPTANSFTWDLDPALVAGPSYFIKITSNQFGTIFGQGTLFNIIDTPEVTVASPNGGEFFVRGFTYNIRWTNTASDSEFITIELLKNGAFVESIAPIAQLSLKRFEWTPESTLTPGDDYQIRIALINFGGPAIVEDTSDANFSIGDGRPWYFAEGNNTLIGETPTDASFYETFLLLVNPGNQQAIVDITYFFEDQDPFVLQDQLIGAQSRVTFNARNVLNGLANPNKRFGMSVVTKNGIEVFGERSLFWAPFYPSLNASVFRGAATDSLPTDEPDTDWFLAEGTTTSGRETEIAVLNPNNSNSHIQVTFLVQGGSPFTTEFDVPAERRITIKASDFVPNLNISTRVIALNGVPVVVERTMYGPANGVEKIWSHGAMAVNNDAPKWFFAEGAVHNTFETFFLLGNTNSAPVQVEFQFLLQTGSVVSHSLTVSANERRTLNVEQDVPGMTDQAGFSTTVRSLNGAPFIAERAMFFRETGFTERTGATAVVGIPEPAVKWFLPEGAVNGVSRFECFVLIGNPGNTASDVNVTFLRPAGLPPVETTLTVNGNSRSTVNVSQILPFGTGATQSFSTIVESTNSVPIIVERAMFLGRADNPAINRIDGTASQGIPVD